MQGLCTTAEGSFSLSVPLSTPLPVCMYLALIYVFNDCIEFRYPKFCSLDLLMYTSTLELCSFVKIYIDFSSFRFSKLNNSIKYLVNKSFKKNLNQSISNTSGAGFKSNHRLINHSRYLVRTRTVWTIDWREKGASRKANPWFLGSHTPLGLSGRLNFPTDRVLPGRRSVSEAPSWEADQFRVAISHE